MKIPAEQCCAFSPIKSLEDTDTREKITLLESRGIEVLPCTAESVDRVLKSQDGKIHFGFFGATHCDACALAVEELDALLHQGDTNIGKAHYFPTETAAAGVLHQDKLKEEVGGGLDVEKLAKEALGGKARLDTIVKERLDDVIGMFLDCTNDRLREASGWRAESVPVFVVSGKEKVWVRSGFLTSAMMDRMTKAYEKGGAYEEFVIRDLPQKLEELEERVRELRGKETTDYKEWYPLWSALEAELKFARKDHLPVHKFPPRVGGDTVTLSIVPNAERVNKPVEAVVSREEYQTYIGALGEACGLTEKAINAMEAIAAQERAVQNRNLSEREKAVKEREARMFYSKKRNLPGMIRDVLRDDLKTI